MKIERKIYLFYSGNEGEHGIHAAQKNWRREDSMRKKAVFKTQRRYGALRRRGYIPTFNGYYEQMNGERFSFQRKY